MLSAVTSHSLLTSLISGSSLGVKMHPLFLIVLCAGLCCATSDSQPKNLEILMDNVLVLRVPHAPGMMNEVPLTCGEAYTNKPVFWKKNGKAFTPALQGNEVKVLVKEMKGGNYTCHLSSNGEYLNHTVVMVQLKPDNRTVILENKSPEEGHIHCSAPNYNASFHCTWTRTKDRSHAAVLLVKAERFMDEISCVLDADGSGVSCQGASCPYKEEQHSISLTIYLYSSFRLEGYTKSFYLRDIVKPAQLPNLHISNGGVFSWDYPDSWEKPCTYFGLHFQVKAVPSGHSCHSEDRIMINTTDQAKYEVNIKEKKYVFCVRAQDKHTMGPWSHWSQYNVNNKVRRF